MVMAYIGMTYGYGMVMAYGYGMVMAYGYGVHRDGLYRHDMYIPYGI